MSVSIEEVLALLPEMFPGTQQVPLDHIHPNPDNPGPPISQEELQDLMESIQTNGLQNPLKLMPDQSHPLVPGVQIHPENLRVTSEGRPWRVEDFQFITFSGNGRYEALVRLHWEKAPSYVMNPSPEEWVILGRIDNKVRQKGWWADYQDIEALIKANPKQTQREVAVKLGEDLPQVNRALSLLPLLNPEARSGIVSNANNSNKGIWGISERAVARLADLGPGTGLKPGAKASGEGAQALYPYPAIPPKTQDLVQRALRVAMDQQMTEAQVKKLVEWVKAGNGPESFSLEKTQPVQPAVGSDKTPHSSLLTHRSSGAQEDEEDFEPIPWSEAAKNPEYWDIPTSRIRVNPFIAEIYAGSSNVERRALAMRAADYTGNLKVRRLSAAEKEADPRHDYELFDDLPTLEGAQWLGWESLPAQVYDIDEWEGVRLHNHLARVTIPLTWIEVYAVMEKLVKDASPSAVAKAAIGLQEDPAEAQRVFPVLKLLNGAARDAISESVRRCYEGRCNMGGYRFVSGLAIPLGRLEKFSKNLSETQEAVGKVVETAIENEMGEDEIEGLVDRTLLGDKPGNYFGQMVRGN